MALPDRFELLRQLASNEQMREILRRYKQDTDIPEAKQQLLIGGNREDLLGRLEAAVYEDLIPEEEIDDLVRECEENGRQYILYFRPRTKEVAAIAGDGAGVANSLFGKGWSSKMNFPRYFEDSKAHFEETQKSVWADFRIRPSGKHQDWIAKLYTREKSLRLEKSETKPDGRVVKTFEPIIERVVWVARWNPPDLLEVRISRCESRTTLSLRVNSVWKHFSKLFDRETDFIEWDVRAIRKRMLAERQKHATIYVPGSVQLTDSQSGKVSVHPNTPEEGTDDAAERGVAIDAILSHGSSVCDHLVITFLAETSEGQLERDIRITLGSKYDHEILVPSHATSTAIDYVTNKLRSFA